MVRISSNIISMSEISENLPSKNIDGAVIQNLWMSYKQHSQNTSGIPLVVITLYYIF